MLNFSGFAQKEANVWHFATSSATDFNSGVPVYNQNSAIVASEGSASICDSSGVLQFYTNGETVWNANHQVMVNGNGLDGWHSSVQPCVITPDPAGCRRYYIFTADGRTSSPWGVPLMYDSVMTYSIVDMNLQNGLGEVVVKNQLLMTGIDERIAAVQHANDKDYWVATHNPFSSSIHAFRVTANGVMPAVISSMPFVSVPTMLKFSPNGKYIALAGFFPIILEFNDTTGVCSNPIVMPSTSTGLATSCSFSPNSRYFYYSGDGDLRQADMQAANIPNSSITVAAAGGMCSLQNAPDGKIYGAP
ncbi:MAG: hypothetical protein AAF570_14510, partial [Bacteroidota bacterium]